MPLYEFKCNDCGIFDAWRAIAEYDRPANCPDCDRPAKRIFSPPTAILSGSLRLKKENPEPTLIKRDREPKQPRIQTHNGSRPWAIGH
jgi:putative FmdB family regulatory protein